MMLIRVFFSKKIFPEIAFNSLYYRCMLQIMKFADGRI